MISFRKYPGRTEPARITHMKRIAKMVERMLMTFLKERGKAP
jgi:hypothetical protein